jgi:peroxiredoxin (alkyl hydroperoxide reductase subunit C)
MADNELIKDRVIIPPANNVADALKRKESCGDNGYDWWFCHKNLE